VRLALLEWQLPDEWELDRAAEANPASWVTAERLEEQREAVHELAFRRFHANQWTSAEGYWLPPGAWQGRASDYTIEPGEPVWVGVDVGGSRAASAVVWVTEDLRVGCEVFEGTEAVLAVEERVRRLAGEQDVRACAYDPWRFQQAALELEQERLVMAEFPQSHARMVPASERLYAAVVEGRLKHPDDAALNAHVAAATAKQTPRGWRLDKSDRNAQIDAVVALAMALEAAAIEAGPSIYEQRGMVDLERRAGRLGRRAAAPAALPLRRLLEVAVGRAGEAGAELAALGLDISHAAARPRALRRPTPKRRSLRGSLPAPVPGCRGCGGAAPIPTRIRGGTPYGQVQRRLAHGRTEKVTGDGW